MSYHNSLPCFVSRDLAAHFKQEEIDNFGWDEWEDEVNAYFGDASGVPYFLDDEDREEYIASRIYDKDNEEVEQAQADFLKAVMKNEPRDSIEKYYRLLLKKMVLNDEKLFEDFKHSLY